MALPASRSTELPDVSPRAEHRIEAAGFQMLRYALAAVFLWIGLLKFTEYEAIGIEPFLVNSAIWSPLHQSMGLRNLSKLIGVIEVSIGLLMAARSVSPLASAIGSGGAALTFIITLSFMATTPGVWQPGYGFPYPSPMPGQFLAKDLVLLAASVCTAGEAYRAARVSPMNPGAAPASSAAR